MCGPISGREYSSKWVVSQCCCGCTLRTGSLILGWLQFVGSILYLINVIMGSRQAGHQLGSIQYVNVVINLISGICLLIGVYKQHVKFLWTAVYLNFVIVVFSIIFAIILFVYLLWIPGVIQILNIVLSTYFFLVIRSYAFEVESGGGAAPSMA